MSKIISKTEAVKIINQLDELEIVHEAIDRAEAVPSKQNKLSRFITSVQKQIKDDRDVVLIAVKVK